MSDKESQRRLYKNWPFQTDSEQVNKKGSARTVNGDCVYNVKRFLEYHILGRIFLMGVNNVMNTL